MSARTRSGSSFRRRQYVRVSVAVFVAGLALGFILQGRGGKKDRPLVDNEHAWVEHWLDGDTLILTGGERVRLLDVDTPEMHYHQGLPPEPGAVEATEFVRRLAPPGTEVIVERHGRDQHGRTLAFVYVGGQEVGRLLLDRRLAREYPRRKRR